MNNFSFLNCGDSALTIQFDKKINEEVNACVTSLCHILQKEKIVGVTETVPTFTSLTVCYNPSEITSKKLKKKIIALSKNINTSTKRNKKIYLIPVCYDDEFSFDMKNVSSHSGLSKDEIINIHTGIDYLIYMLGFLPGFAYLGGLDERLVTPRLDSPRTLIPEGSVGIGGEQTGIYPLASPGGWQLIGRTPIKVFDIKKSEILYSSGDYIRFFSIDKNEYEKIKNEVNNGTYKVKIIEEDKK